MSEVHKAITAHSQKQNHIVKTFLQLDELREYYIEESVKLCQENKPFSVDKINEVTKRINELAKNGIAPVRKLVTEEMVCEYANRLQALK